MLIYSFYCPFIMWLGTTSGLNHIKLEYIINFEQNKQTSVFVLHIYFLILYNRNYYSVQLKYFEFYWIDSRLRFIFHFPLPIFSLLLLLHLNNRDFKRINKLRQKHYNMPWSRMPSLIMSNNNSSNNNNSNNSSSNNNNNNNNSSGRGKTEILN